MEHDRRLSVVLRVGLVVLFVWMVWEVLVPIMLGGLFALLMHPIRQRLERRMGRAHGYAPLVLATSTLVLVVVPFVFIAIETVRSINRILARDWSPLVGRLQSFFTEGIYFRGRTIHIGGSEIQSAIQDLGQRLATEAANAVSGIAAAVPSIVLTVFLFAVALYYFLRDGEELVDWLYNQSPFPDDQTTDLFSSVRETVDGAILGIIATALVQGGLTFTALAIFDIPNAFLLAILAMVLSVIPLVGTTPVTVGSAIYLFVIGRFGAGVGMIIALVIIGLSDNVVRPWVQSSQSNMHPLVVLLGIFGGLELFGAAGVFLGPVVAAMAVWSVETYVKYNAPDLAELRASQSPRASLASRTPLPPRAATATPTPSPVKTPPK
ncbi:MAG TPA: AI-2E family transporter [Polyangium sp.]|nr:AI-2E family transporter [Polyangium sp.]